MSRRPSVLILCCGLLWLAGCGTAPEPLAVPEGSPTDFPRGQYDASKVAELYALDAASSLVAVRVYRAGPLARLGHDHVVSLRNVEGLIAIGRPAPDALELTAEGYSAIGGWQVDEPALRAEAGFDTEPSAEDRAGTRSNLQKSLEAAAYPWLRFSMAVRRLPDTTPAELPLRFELAGQAREVTVPVEFLFDGDTLAVSSRFRVRQSELGIEPFSIMGGALSVADELDVELELRARRVSSARAARGTDGC